MLRFQGIDKGLTEAASVPPVIEASHIRIHVIDPTNESTQAWWVGQVKPEAPILTNKNKAVNPSYPTNEDTGIFCKSASRLSIHRQRCQIQQRVAGTRVIPDATTDPS